MSQRVGVAGLGVLVVGLGVLCLSGCHGQTPAAGEPAPAARAQESAVRVETLRPAREDLQRVTEPTPAELLPIEQTDLYARVTGFLQEIRVDIGDRVKKGGTLAVLAAPEMEREVEQKQALVKQAEAGVDLAQAALTAAEANLKTSVAQVGEAEAGRKRAQANYDRWASEYRRMEELVRKGTLDQQARDEALNQFRAADAARAEVEAKIESVKAMRDESAARRDKARADVRAAEAHLEVSKADLGQAAAMLQYTRVAAPFDGVIVKRNLHTGAFLTARAGEQPLLTITRTDVLRVVVDIPERDVSYLDKDATVRVEWDALAGKKFEEKITRFAPVLGSGKRVRAEVHIPNADGKLYPGMYGRATVILQHHPQALTLPAATVGNDDKGPYVYTVADGKAKRRYVALGMNDGKKVEIVSGLSGTEEVIASGRSGLQDDQPVLPQPVAATSLKK